MADEARKGVQWQRVQANGLSQANQKLYRGCVATFAQATEAAARLTAASARWSCPSRRSKPAGPTAV
jgi:hypothetical protein